MLILYVAGVVTRGYLQRQSPPGAFHLRDYVSEIFLAEANSFALKKVESGLGTPIDASSVEESSVSGSSGLDEYLRSTGRENLKSKR